MGEPIILVHELISSFRLIPYTQLTCFLLPGWLEGGYWAQHCSKGLIRAELSIHTSHTRTSVWCSI